MNKIVIVIFVLLVVALGSYLLYRDESPTVVYDSFGKLKGFANSQLPLDLAGQQLTRSSNTYCRDGLTMPEVVEGENDMWRFQVYTVQPGALNGKFRSVQC
jgi:hypothetical protein